MGAPPLTQAQREAIAADIRDTAGTADGSVRRIAARNQVAMGSVRRVAVEYGLGAAWRTGSYQTEAATVAKSQHLAERRAQLQADLLDDIEELRERLFGDVIHLNVVKDGGPMAGEHVEQTVLPGGADHWQRTMSAITGAAGRSIELARMEMETTGTGAAGLLDQFEVALRGARADREQVAEAEYGPP